MKENHISLLKILEAKQEAFFFKEAPELYIPPLVGQFVGDEKPKGVAETIDNWLNNSDKQCLLLLGDSGAGKTLFGQWLARQSFKSKRRIPLFIPLFSQKDPSEGLIDRYLKKMCEITDKWQRELIKQQPLLLILDGFDEMHKKINLYQSNKLWQLKDAKIIISCRSQALMNIRDYASLFCAYNAQNTPQPHQLQEYVINPFTEEQIDTYLQHYVKTHQLQIKKSLSQTSHQKNHQNDASIPVYDWMKWETYRKVIQTLPGLQRFISSPFVLSLVVQVLPTIMLNQKGGDHIQQLQLARINLYDHFVSQWFARQKQKLLDAEHINEDCPIEEAFMEYSKALAHAMLQKGVASVEYNPKTETLLLKGHGLFSSYSSQQDMKDDDPWAMFFIEKPYKVGNYYIGLSLIRAGCPLIKLGENQYAFLHKSLLEYFAAIKLFKGAMSSASIALGCELNEKLLVNEPETLNFLAERVEQDDKLKERLFDVLEESKYEERVQIAAANAITILNYANVPLSGKNFKYIRIRGADLSHSILDYANFADADLREVSLKKAWLNQTKAGGALMQSVEFDELPYLQTSGRSIAYYPESMLLLFTSYKAVTNNNLYFYLDQQDESVWYFTKKNNELIKHPLIDNQLVDEKNNFDISEELLRQLKKSIKNKTLQSIDEKYRKTLLKIAIKRKHAHGTYMAVGNTLYENYHKIAVFKGQKSEYLVSVAFSPCGEIIATGSWDKTIRLWDLEKHTLLKELRTPMDKSTDGVNCVAFSANGKILASGGGREDKTVYLWDMGSHKLLAQLKGHEHGVDSLSFSPTNNLLASVSQNGVFLWDIEKYTLVCTFVDVKFPECVAFNLDGKLLAAGGWKGTTCLWEVKSQRLLANLKISSDERIASVDFSPNGEILAVGGGDKTVSLWDVKHHKILAELKGHMDPIEDLSFDPEGKILASVDWSGKTHLWKIKVGLNKTATKRGTCAGKILGIAYNATTELIASGGEDSIIRLWDLKNGKCRDEWEKYKSKSIYDESKFRSLAFNPSGEILATGNWDHSIQLWDVKSGKCIMKWETPGLVSSVCFSPSGDMMASSHWGTKNDKETVCLWDVKSSMRIVGLSGHKDVDQIVFSPNGKLLASAGRGDGTVRLWDLKSGEHINTLSVFSFLQVYVSCVAFDPMGNLLACGMSCNDQTIRLWDVKNGTQIGKLQGHPDSTGVKCVVFSPDGKILVSGGCDQAIRLWDIKNGKCLNTFNFTHDVEDLVSYYKEEEEKTYLCAAMGDNVFCFELKTIGVKPQLILQWSTASRELKCVGLDLGGVIGLNEKKEQLLKQRGASGKLSEKKTEDVLEARRHAIPYNSQRPPSNLFSSEHFITPKDAMVTMARKKEGDKNAIKHVFLVVEYVNESNYYTIIRSDFFLDQKQNSWKGSVLVSGQGMIEICAKPLSDMQILAKQCVYKRWKLTQAQVKDLLGNLENDRLKQISYLNTGNSILYSAIQPGTEKHNCLTWCEGHISKIGIKLNEQKSWLNLITDFVVVHPEHHLPNIGEEPTSNQSCLIM